MDRQSKSPKERLTAGFVKDAPAGSHGDGGRGSHGLRLVVQEGGSRSWIQVLRINGKPTTIGLGRAWNGRDWIVTLPQARKMAYENHLAAQRGEDPRPDRKARRHPGAAGPGSSGVTFEQALEKVIDIRAPSWSDSSRDDNKRTWRSQARAYAPDIMGKDVADITPDDVLGVLEPLWHERPTLGKKMRQRISQTMKWAVAAGHRADNPASDALDGVLPKQKAQVEHRAALEHEDLARALLAVREQPGHWHTRAAIEFVAFTAVRSGEACRATWDEIDMEDAVWGIPAERTKTGAALRVPLSGGAMSVLDRCAELRDGTGWVFPASRKGSPLGCQALSRLLSISGLGFTVHGLRTSFRSWAADQGVPRDQAEMCLGHKVKGVEGTYQRSDILDLRRGIMDEWCDYLSLPPYDSLHGRHD